MKNTFTFLLALFLLSACDGGKSGNTGAGGTANTGSVPSQNTTKAGKRVIKASELISREDAAALLGQSMKDGEIPKRPFIDESKYVSQNYFFSIALCQEALRDKNSDFEKNLLKNGWANYMKEMEKAYSKNYHKQNIIETGSIDGKSYLQDGGAMGLWSVHLFYGEYYILINLGNTSLSRKDGEAETAWKQGILKEAGTLAVGRLKEIITDL